MSPLSPNTEFSRRLTGQGDFLALLEAQMRAGYWRFDPASDSLCCSAGLDQILHGAWGELWRQLALGPEVALPWSELRTWLSQHLRWDGAEVQWVRDGWKSQKSLNLDVHLTTPQGGRWYRLLAEPEQPEAGLNSPWRGWLLDVSEQKRAQFAQEEAERRYREIFEFSSDCIYSIAVRDGGRFEYDDFNLMYAQMTGLHIEDACGRSLEELLPLDVAEQVLQHCRTCLHTGQSLMFEEVFHMAGRETTCLTALIPIRDAEGHIYRIAGIGRDVTAQTQAVLALRQSEQRWNLALEANNDGIWDWDVRSNRVYYSGRWKSLLGYGEQELGRGLNEWTDRVHPQDWPQLESRLQSLREGNSRQLLLEHRLQHKNGEYRWFRVSAVVLQDPDTDEIQRMVGALSDITDRKKAEARIQHLANHDGLTGLPNRMLLKDRMEQAIVSADRSASRMAVLFIDLDRFKHVNDSLGHSAGDMLLKVAAARLLACVRDGDTVARQGGDEFVVVLKNMPSADHVSRIAEKIVQGQSKPYRFGDLEVTVSCSIGISIYPDNGLDTDALLKHADAAMYHAKSKGRNNFQFYEPEMNARILERLAMEQQLRRALERGELCLHYQPQICLKEGRLAGVEALMRWQHPQQGMIPPVKFIPVAEDSGLIVPMGEWLLEEACRQNRAWLDAGHPPIVMAVNISANQFRDSGFYQKLEQVLQRTGLPPGNLEIEITESVLMQDADQVVQTLFKLKDLGVRLAIDDFGTGYSSLSYLKRFAVDTLKIDRSFISDINLDADDAAIVQAILSMAHKLNLGVVAEGVETVDQLNYLRGHHCDWVQGYFFSPPKPAAAITDFFTQPWLGRSLAAS